MQIVLSGSASQIAAFREKNLTGEVNIIIAGESPLPERADLWFDLGFSDQGNAFPQVTADPILVNAVALTQQELAPNQIRFNAWEGLWERSILEIAAGHEEYTTRATALLTSIGLSYTIVPDVPGMVSARVVSMIINEAYFALGDGVSSREEIDIAMQLGTNYPYGPFAWARLIGPKRIHSLLHKLSQTDSRYTPAPALEEEVMNMQ
jgi:3-hydroxybutyryl-CoA dehydrogenase